MRSSEGRDPDSLDRVKDNRSLARKSDFVAKRARELMQKAAVQDGVEIGVLFSWPSNRSSMKNSISGSEDEKMKSGLFGFEGEEPTIGEMAANIHVLDSYPVVIGRSHDADIVADGKSISRKHLEVSLDNDKWYVKDLNSTNGTTLNGKPLSNRRRRLENGNVIELASSMRYVFQSPTSNKRNFETFFEQEFHTSLPLNVSRWNLLRLEHLGFSDLSGLFVSVETITRGSEENGANFAGCLIDEHLVQGSIDHFLQRTEPQGLFGWWGHGINSYAFYYQIITSERRFFFRLPFGGGLSDIDADRNHVVEFLSSYADFEEEFGPMIKSATLIFSINPRLDYEIRLDREGDGPPYTIKGVIKWMSGSSLFQELKIRVASATN